MRHEDAPENSDEIERDEAALRHSRDEKRDMFCGFFFSFFFGPRATCGLLDPGGIFWGLWRLRTVGFLGDGKGKEGKGRERI